MPKSNISNFEPNLVQSGCFRENLIIKYCIKLVEIIEIVVHRYHFHRHKYLPRYKQFPMFCPDYSEFQDILKKMRVLDDKIVYTLNTSIPTESFKGKVDATSACKDLFMQIQKGHSERENVIKYCIVSTADTVKNLKAAKAENPDNFDTLKNLKSEQRKLRLLQTELSVEEVIKEKTTKLFSEKCRTYYKPETL